MLIEDIAQRSGAPEMFLGPIVLEIKKARLVASARGWAGGYVLMRARRARSAIRLTRTVAAIALPLTAAFGIAVSRAITEFDFHGKALLITLIDLPFPVTSGVAGLSIMLLCNARAMAASGPLPSCPARSAAGPRPC